MAAQSEEMEIDQEVVDEKVMDDETRDNPQEEEEAEGEDEDEVEDEAEAEAEEDGGEDQPGKKRTRNPPKAFTREPGKSVLPLARVQKIIKADKEIPMVAKDAVFLISIATEAFIEELIQAGQRVADKYNRTMIQHEDIATVVRKADEFMFLEDIMPWTREEKRSKVGGCEGGYGESYVMPGRAPR